MSHSATLRLLLAALQAVHEAAPAEHGATPEHGAHGGAHGGEHGGVHEAEEPESGEEPEEEEESHSIFALPTLTNKRVNLLTWIIVGLIGVTIAFERLTEFLEEEYFSSGIRKQIWQMMLRELTILGFVSFVATVILQFVLIPEEDKQIFEYAHVLMFTLAIFYAAQIAITAFQLGGIVKTFNKQDEEPDEDLLKAEKDYWERAAKTNPIRRFWRRCSFLNRATNNMISGSTFKVLRFHFMSRSGLLGKAKFEWAAYVTRSMEKHIEEMLEVQMTTWFVLAALVAASSCVKMDPMYTMGAFAAGGWLLLVAMVGLLYLTDKVLNNLLYDGHRLRQRCKEHMTASRLGGLPPPSLAAAPTPGSTGNNLGAPLLSHQLTASHLLRGKERGDASATLRQAELAFAVQTQKTPSLMSSFSKSMEAIKSEDEARHHLHRTASASLSLSRAGTGSLGLVSPLAESSTTRPLSPPLVLRDQSSNPQVPPEAHRTTPGAALEPGKEVSAHGGAEGHGGAHHGAHRHGPLALLRKLCSADGDNEPGGRLLLVLPSLVQIVLVLMCLLQAMLLTLLGRDYILLFSGEGKLGPDDEPDATGAWQGALLIAATLVPTLLMSFFVSPLALKNISLANAAAQEDKEVLHELETEFEQSGDYAAANQALELAANSKLCDEDLHDDVVVRAKVKDLIKLGEMRWRYRVVDEGQSPRDEAIAVLEEAKKNIEDHVRACSADSKLWSDELSEVKQGLALARLIFNKDRSEDGVISSLLKDALSLREEMRDLAKMAESLNSLGALRQKQKAYKDAESYFRKSLDFRQQMKAAPGEKEFEKNKAQAVAQSLTSLGNLYTELGESAVVMEEAAEKEEADAEAAHAKAQAEAAERRRAEQHELRQQYFGMAKEQLELAKAAYVKGFNESHPKVAWALEGIARVCQKSGHFREAQAAWEEAIAIRNYLQETGTGKQLFTAELQKAQAAMSEISTKREATKVKFAQLRNKNRILAAIAASKGRGGANPDSAGGDAVETLTFSARGSTRALVGVPNEEAPSSSTTPVASGSAAAIN